MRRHVRRIFAAVAVLAVLMALPQVAFAGPKDKQPVFDFETFEPIVGAFSQLDRAEDAVTTKVRTRVEPGHAFTVWYVIFNNPDACLDGGPGVCGLSDVELGPGELNIPQIEAARISVVWGNSGGVANPAGRIKLDGGLAVGEVPDGEGQVLIGLPEHGAIAPVGVVTGMESADGEIHLVLQDHGIAHDDPDLRELQVSAFQGACNPDCVDVQFSVHK